MGVFDKGGNPPAGAVDEVVLLVVVDVEVVLLVEPPMIDVLDVVAVVDELPMGEVVLVVLDVLLPLKPDKLVVPAPPEPPPHAVIVSKGIRDKKERNFRMDFLYERMKTRMCYEWKIAMAKVNVAVHSCFSLRIVKGKYCGG
jgi:hypothetical protein